MLTDAELRVLLADLESDRIERTTALKDIDKFSKAYCAFANDMPQHRQPGYLVVGVRDNGSLASLKVTDELLRDLAGARENGKIQPIPSINVQKFIFPEGEVAVVEVLPSDMPPVRYDGRTWIRIGPRKAIASLQQEKILTERRIASAHKTWDLRPCEGSSISDLALDLFTLTYRPQAVAKEVIEANHRSHEEQLAALRFFDSSRPCPTNAGVLLFGKEPLNWIPGAYIQFLRLKGTSLDEAVSEKKISGDLLSVLREMDSLIDVYINASREDVTALKERQVWDYPPRAIREVLLNAIVHRDYSSNAPVRFYWFDGHIEIQNSGGLFGAAKFSGNIPVHTDYRNPVLAESAKILGYVNRYGTGVQRAQDALKENGNPPAEYTLDQNFISVTIKCRTK